MGVRWRIISWHIRVMLGEVISRDVAPSSVLPWTTESSYVDVPHWIMKEITLMVPDLSMPRKKAGAVVRKHSLGDFRGD